MAKVTFVLNTSADMLANWMQTHWEAPVGAHEKGTIWCQGLQKENQPNKIIVLISDAILASYAVDESGNQKFSLLDKAFVFILQPLTEQKVEVQAICNVYPLLNAFLWILRGIAKRWPEIRNTIEHLFDSSSDHFCNDPVMALNLYDDFNETVNEFRYELRKIVSWQLEGKHPCGAIFYLDNTTAQDAATWLTTNWDRTNKHPPGIWCWDVNYHHGRKHRVGAMAEATDQRGRILLTVGMTEWETTHPDPLSVPFGVLAIPPEQGAIVQENGRALEILITTAGVNLVEVEARCNALLLLNNFTGLLKNIKIAYGERLRLVRPSFGVMDADPLRNHPMVDEYFKQQHSEYARCIERINPAFAIYRAAPSTEPVSEPVSDAVSDDSPDEDDIPRYGRRRDLSTREVKEIVKRCKKFKKLDGGTISKFYDQESRKWPDPEDAPKSYSEKTLQNWMINKRFQ